MSNVLHYSDKQLENWIVTTALERAHVQDGHDDLQGEFNVVAWPGTWMRRLPGKYGTKCWKPMDLDAGKRSMEAYRP